MRKMSARTLRQKASPGQLLLDLGQGEENVSKPKPARPGRSDTLQRIKRYLSKSDYLGVLSGEEVKTLIDLLMQLLEIEEKMLRNHLVSEIVGHEVKASDLAFGDKPLGILLRQALRQESQKQKRSYSLDRIADVSAEQIVAGIAEVRDSLEATYVRNEQNELEKVVSSSELLKYFPKFSRLVYGSESVPMP